MYRFVSVHVQHFLAAKFLLKKVMESKKHGAKAGAESIKKAGVDIVLLF